MYICRSKDDTIAQYELNDFLGYKRTIVFDLDNPSEARRARRVLRPKGISRRRSKKKTQIDHKFQQKPLGIFENRDQNPKIQTEKTVKASTSINTRTTARQQHFILATKSPGKNFKTKAKKQRITRKGEQMRQQLSSHRSKTKKKRPTSSRRHLKPKHPSKTNSIHLRSDLPESKVTKPSRIITPVIDKTKFDDLGYGGEIEVPCPYCGDLNYFDYEDLDEKRMISTRMCNCSALLRISILSHHRALFDDLLIQGHIPAKMRKQTDTHIHDEFGNTIKIHGFRVD